ncbi:MAG: alpha/beta fold hydrolase [Chloroflexota bacterium]
MAKSKKNLLENSDGLVLAATGAGAILAALGATIGGWIGYSALGVNHRVPLPDAIEGQRHMFVSSNAGILNYYVDRSASGRPLVLIHSINAAGSAYEMRPLFLHYRSQRPVYALDLPGFGFSDRSKRAYSPRLYTDAILGLLETQIRNGPVDLVALSLGSEFAARAALERPDLINSLTLISPSGFARRGNEKGPSQQASGTNKSDSLYRGFTFPVWSQSFYDLLATPVSIKYFLKQSFQGPVDKGLIDYAYATTHQPGARNAPLYFVSGKLFTPDIYSEVYEKLSLPVQVLYDRDAFVRFDRLPEIVQNHPNWHLTRIAPTKGLPQWEQLEQTTQALDSFWREAN